MVVLIWLFSFLASAPTLFMYRYWVRTGVAIQFNFNSDYYTIQISNFPDPYHYENATDSVSTSTSKISLQTRQWSDLLEIVCDEAPEAEWTVSYWWITIVFLVWIPTLIMAACYGFIFRKIKRSARKNPYLSGWPETNTDLIPAIFLLL